MVLRGAFTADEAVRDAMNAALAGDFYAADRLEATYINVLVRIGDIFVKDEHGTPWWWFNVTDGRYASLADRGLAPFVIEYHRRWGPACAPALEWRLMPVCRRCAGKLRRLECRICNGDWYVGDSPEGSLFTSDDGVVLEIDS